MGKSVNHTGVRDMEFLSIVGSVAIFAAGYVAAIFTWNKIKAYFGLTIGV